MTPAARGNKQAELHAVLEETHCYHWCPPSAYDARDRPIIPAAQKSQIPLPPPLLEEPTSWHMATDPHCSPSPSNSHGSVLAQWTWVTCGTPAAKNLQSVVFKLCCLFSSGRHFSRGFEWCQWPDSSLNICPRETCLAKPVLPAMCILGAYISAWWHLAQL